MKKSILVIACALVAIIIDMMGLALVLPFLTDLFLSTSSPILSSGVSEASREFYYGLTLALWALGIFFGSPFLGELSDRYGRKLILTLSLGMVALSYFLSFISLFLGSSVLFMLSRLLNGFFSSSFPLAQAIIIDISTDENRTRNLSWIVLAASIGFIIGPLLGAFAYHFMGTGAHAAAWTFFSAALLSSINAFGVAVLLREGQHIRSLRYIHLFSVITTCRFIFMDKRVQILAFIFFFMQMAWGIYIQSIPVILTQKFFQSPEAISLFYAFLGVCFLVMTLWIQPVLLKFFDLKNLAFMPLLIMICSAGMAAFESDIRIQWLIAIPFSMADCLCYTALIALFSAAVSPDEQGRVMGGAGAIFGLTWGGIGFGLGSILSASLTWPFYLSMICSILAALFFLAFRKKT